MMQSGFISFASASSGSNDSYTKESVRRYWTLRLMLTKHQLPLLARCKSLRLLLLMFAIL